MSSSRQKRRNEAKAVIQQEKKKKSRELQHARRKQKKKEIIGVKHLSIKAKIKDVIDGLKKRENRDATVLYMPNSLYEVASVWLEDGKFNETVDVVAWDLELHGEIITELGVDVKIDLVAD
jgi:vacuolar-type H+-ATPase subunit I/STV1